jgi:uncharacterized DUF497 family protein
MAFRWNDWNIERIGCHGVSPEKAELVIKAAQNPYPRRIQEEKWIVWGQGSGGRFLQVVFVLDQDKTTFVIHARLLTEPEKQRFRRGKKR